MNQKEQWSYKDMEYISPEQIEFWYYAIRPNVTYEMIQKKYNISSTSVITGLIRTALRTKWWPKYNGGGDDYLSKVDSNSLADWASQRYDQLNCVYTPEIRQKAYELKLSRISKASLELFGIGNHILSSKLLQMQNQTMPPSRPWVNKWAKKFGFHVTKAREIEIARLKAADPALINQWMQSIQQILYRPPELIFNCDETFISFKKNYKVIQCGNYIPVVQKEEANHLTGMICFNATGTVITPMIILPSLSNIPDELINFQNECLFTSSSTGWITTNLWAVWAIHFVIEIRRYRLKLPPHIRNSKILLVLDGNSSRSTPFIIDLFRKENIDLLILPSHLTHILQPFDVVIASELKITFRSCLLEHFNHNQKLNLSNAAKLRLNYVGAFLDAVKKSLTISKCRKAFESTGLYPFDISVPFKNPFLMRNTEMIITRVPVRAKSYLPISGKLLTSDDEFNNIVQWHISKSPLHPCFFYFSIVDIGKTIRLYQLADVSQGKLIGFMAPYVLQTTTMET